ncbi:MAG: fused MFS/spermidine synthase [Planctomycetota bacterium]|nr:fused MFS/spermidine synthase [Planctomycetota bacterium]
MSEPLADAAEPREDRGGGVGEGLLLLIVGLAGAATMVVELGAVRVLAPWFGTSSSVWTNVIGVVLAALALGYALGARLAAGEHPQRKLGTVLVLAGLLSAALLPAARPVAELLMPSGVPLHRAAGVLVWGSLACAALLFLPAAAALGCAGPLAVESLQRRRGGAAGAAGGRVLAASTVGSLVGTFGTTHWAIPTLGIAATYVLASLSLLGVGALLVLRAGRPGAANRAAAGLTVLLCGAALGTDAASRAHSGEGALLAAVESPMQSIRAVEVEGPDGAPMRILRVNEALDSFQSVWVPTPGLLPEGYYYNLFALPVGWTALERGQDPERWRALVIGLGAGTAVRVLEGVVPAGTALETVGVEVDEAVLRIAQEHFELEAEAPGRVAAGGLDGRAALAFMEGSFDQIILDAYANNMEVPHHLATVEAFRAYRKRLSAGGWLTVNVGGFGPQDPIVQALSASVAAAFGDEVFLGRVPLSRNWVIFARRDGRVPRPGERSFGSRPATLPYGLGRLVATLEVPGAWVRSGSGAGPLRDDIGSTATLQARSISAAAAHLSALDIAREPAPERSAVAAIDETDAAREEAARAALGRREFTDALATADGISDPGTRGRVLADLHWRAGSPLAALEIATEALLEAPNDLGLLALAIDCGYAVGANSASRTRLDRLRSLVDGDRAWEPTLARYSRFESEASLGAAGADGALIRARAALLLAAAALAVAIWGFSRGSAAATA